MFTHLKWNDSIHHNEDLHGIWSQEPASKHRLNNSENKRNTHTFTPVPLFLLILFVCFYYGFGGSVVFSFCHWSSWTSTLKLPHLQPKLVSLFIKACAQSSNRLTPAAVGTLLLEPSSLLPVLPALPRLMRGTCVVQLTSLFLGDS